MTRLNWRRPALPLAAAVVLLWNVPAIAGPLASPTTDTDGVSQGDILKYDVVSPGMLGLVALGTDNATLLAGDAVSPGGHIELFGSSESVSNAAYDASTTRTSLRGTLAGNEIVLSSLTAADWATTVSTGQSLLRQWLLDAASAHGVDLETATVLPLLGSVVPIDLVEAAFIDAQGRQRFADPNIAYVNRDDFSGDVTIGLSGYLNAHDEISDLLSSTGLFGSIIATALPNPIQVSELVRVDYLGNSIYLYGLLATPTGLSAGDTYDSGSGIFNLTIDGATGLPLTGVEGVRAYPASTVPEPSAIALLALGLVAFGIISHIRPPHPA